MRRFNLTIPRLAALLALCAALPLLALASQVTTNSTVAESVRMTLHLSDLTTQTTTITSGVNITNTATHVAALEINGATLLVGESGQITLPSGTVIKVSVRSSSSGWIEIIDMDELL